MSETWTVLKVLQWTTEYFFQKGLDQPRSDAEVLLAHALNLERIQLYLRHDQPLSESELARYREMIRRRASREPTQYITGKQEFWSLEFEVGPSVLVPRPETEVLVERVLEAGTADGARVLDVGTGSGAIAVALARERPAWTIVATDVSLKALATARKNIERHGVSDRVFLVAGRLLGFMAPERAGFDLIVSNPPYVASKDLPKLPPEVRDHEPLTALEGGGAEGAGTLFAILEQAPRYLKPGGHVFVEFGSDQKDVLVRWMETAGGYEAFEVFEDYAGLPRILHARSKR